MAAANEAMMVDHTAGIVTLRQQPLAARRGQVHAT
jgi:hypothetical protein